MAKRPGKYDHLLHKYPKTNEANGEKIGYQDHVEDAKKALRKCPYCHGIGKTFVCDCNQTIAQVDLEAHASDCQLRITIPCDCASCAGTGRRTLTPTVMAQEYVKRRKEKDVAEALVSLLNLEIEAISQMLVASQELGEEGWGAYGAADNALRLTTGDGIRLQPEIYPVVSDKAAFRDWCVGGPQLASMKLGAKMALPPKDMSDLVKDRLLNGQPEPDGIKVFVKTKIVYSEMQTEPVAGVGADSETF
jgi:hypothetical protein